MDDTNVSATLDCEVAVNVKRWPLVLVAALFLAGVTPAFLTRPAAPPRPAPPPRAAASDTRCTGTPAAATGSATHTESQKPAADANGSC
jgi:hypothetical protein